MASRGRRYTASNIVILPCVVLHGIAWYSISQSWVALILWAKAPATSLVTVKVPRALARGPRLLVKIEQKTWGEHSRRRWCSICGAAECCCSPAFEDTCIIKKGFVCFVFIWVPRLVYFKPELPARTLECFSLASSPAKALSSAIPPSTLQHWTGGGFCQKYLSWVMSIASTIYILQYLYLTRFLWSLPPLCWQYLPPRSGKQREHWNHLVLSNKCYDPVRSC